MKFQDFIYCLSVLMAEIDMPVKMVEELKKANKINNFKGERKKIIVGKM